MSFASIGVSACLTPYFKNVQIRENPKASTRCDGQSLSFHLYQNAGCRLRVDCVWKKVVT